MSEQKPRTSLLKPVWVWGLPLAPLSAAGALAEVESLVEARQPAFFITANLNYAMLVADDPRLAVVNERAAFVLADGMPLIWASRFGPSQLPGRVAGADLVLNVCQRAVEKRWRIFLLGGPPGLAEQAATELTRRYPGLIVAGTECPPFRERTPAEEAALIGRVREAQPHILFVAFGQPKGELWLAKHVGELGVPVSVQIGGSFDFVTGRLRRAPRWMQRTGLEWLYRFLQEPRRLGGRYARNLWFLFRVTLGSLIFRRRKGRRIGHRRG